MQFNVSCPTPSYRAAPPTQSPEEHQQKHGNGNIHNTRSQIIIPNLNHSFRPLHDSILPRTILSNNNNVPSRI